MKKKKDNITDFFLLFTSRKRKLTAYILSMSSHFSNNFEGVIKGGITNNLKLGLE